MCAVLLRLRTFFVFICAQRVTVYGRGKIVRRKDVDRRLTNGSPRSLTPYEVRIKMQHTGLNFDVEKEFVKHCSCCGAENVTGGVIYLTSELQPHYYCDECLYEIEKTLKRGKVNLMCYPGISVDHALMRSCAICDREDQSGYLVRIYNRNDKNEADECEFQCCKRCMGRSISALSSYNYKNNIAAIVTEMLILQRRVDIVTEQNEDLCKKNGVEYTEKTGKLEFIPREILEKYSE